MRRLIAVALLLGLPGFARGQDEPLFHLIVRDPLPLLERATRSPAVQEVFSSRALGDLLPLPKSLTARGLPGLVHFASGMMPTRVEIRIPGTAAKPAVAFLQLGLLCVALVELQDEAEDRAPELRTRLVASLARFLVDLRDLHATATLELRTEAIARQVIDGITEGLVATEEAEEDSMIEVVEDVDTVSATLRLVGADGELTDLVDELQDELAAAGLADPARELVIELSAVRTGTRVELSLDALSGEAAPPEPPEATARDGAILEARWHLDGVQRELTRLGELQGVLRTCESTPARRELDQGIAELAVWTRFLVTVIGSGRMTVAATDRALESEIVQAARGDEVAVASTGLLAHVPLDVELWGACGTSDPVEIATSFLEARSTQPTAADSAGTTSGPSPRRDFASAAGAFARGWAFVATTDGELASDAGTTRRKAPAVALLMRIASVNSGLWCARLLLEQLAAPLHAHLEMGDRSMRLVSDDPKGPITPELQPHAFTIDDVLVLSSSAALSERIRTAARSSGPSPELVSSWSTTGRRLSVLSCWAVEGLLGALFSADDRSAAATALSRGGEMFEAACRLFGEIRSESATRNGEIVTRITAAFAGSDAERDREILAAVRRALGVETTPADRMLVARGKATFYGCEGTFEFSFANDGRFREIVRTLNGLDVAWDGQTYLQDMGHGRFPERSDAQGTARAWAAAMSGQWLREACGFSVTVLDRTADAISIGIRTDADLQDRRLVLDPATWLPRRFDFGAAQASNFLGAVELGDYRKVADRVLPHHIQSHGAMSFDYQVDAWTLEPLDASRFAPGPSAEMVYAAGDAQEARVEAEDDAIYIEGRVGGELGWFLLHPLHEVVLLDGNVFDVLAARSDQPKDATAPLIVRDVELGGVLRADRFKFYRGVDLPKRPGRRILGHIGVDALRSCCVALDQAKPALQILPAGSFTGDDFLPMCTVHQHRAFACELRGGLRSWCIVVPGERNDAFVQPIDYDRFAAASRSGEGPLEDGALAWIDIANQRLKVEHTWRLGVHDRTTVDETPIAIGTKSLSGMVLEMDFPNDRYRFRER